MSQDDESAKEHSENEVHKANSLLKWVDLDRLGRV